MVTPECWRPEFKSRQPHLTYKLKGSVIESGEDVMSSEELTRFEKARIVGARALQLSMGAKPAIEFEGPLDPIDIAVLELKKGLIPLGIRK